MQRNDLAAGASNGLSAHTESQISLTTHHETFVATAAAYQDPSCTRKLRNLIANGAGRDPKVNARALFSVISAEGVDQTAVSRKLAVVSLLVGLPIHWSPSLVQAPLHHQVPEALIIIMYNAKHHNLMLDAVDEHEQSLSESLMRMPINDPNIRLALQMSIANYQRMQGQSNKLKTTAVSVAKSERSLLTDSVLSKTAAAARTSGAGLWLSKTVAQASSPLERPDHTTKRRIR